MHLQAATILLGRVGFQLRLSLGLKRFNPPLATLIQEYPSLLTRSQTVLSEQPEPLGQPRHKI